MMGFGFVVLFLSLAGLWLTRRGRLPGGRWFYGLAVFGLFAPILANSFGWIFTEMGRQPWTVFGVFTDPGQRLAPGERRGGAHLDDRLHRCCTACWP